MVVKTAVNTLRVFFIMGPLHATSYGVSTFAMLGAITSTKILKNTCNKTKTLQLFFSCTIVVVVYYR